MLSVVVLLCSMFGCCCDCVLLLLRVRLYPPALADAVFVFLFVCLVCSLSGRCCVCLCAAELLRCVVSVFDYLCGFVCKCVVAACCVVCPCLLDVDCRGLFRGCVIVF